jgi:hypothetical protein
VTVGNVSTGSHTVALTGVAPNCSVNDSQQLIVSPGNTATAAFTITCTSVVPPGPSASQSSMLADPKLIPTGGSSTIKVTVRDASGAPLANVSVTLSSSGSDNTITPASATTNANGEATFTFSSTNAEDKTITATANGITLNDTEVITVFRRSSSVQITSDQNDPSVQGETITVAFAVTVDGGGTPTGTVDIFSLEEAGVGCTVAVSAGSCTFALGTAGLHHLQASYSGDDQFEASSDPDGEEHTVNPAAAAQALAP